MDKFKNVKNVYIGAAILIAVAALSYRLYPPAPAELTAQNSKTYLSGRYGITFQYPPYYHLAQKDVGTPEREHHVITLTDESVGAIPSGSDGPTALTIDIFENDKDSLTANGFVTGTSFSNYKLGEGFLATSTYGEVTGLEYEWSGLYQGRSFVIARPGYIFMFSGTRDSPNDRIASDYRRILETVTIK